MTWPVYGPDEKVYFEHGRTLREHGLRRGFDLLAARYLRDPGAADYPSPIRYGWALLMAATGRRTLPRAALVLAPVALAWAVLPLLGWHGAALALVLGATSPLLWQLGRRELQDAPIATLALVALGLALRGEPIGLAITLATLLACKEAAALYLPAIALTWLLQGHPLGSLALATAAALVLWTIGAWLTLRSAAVPVLLRALGGHDTDYTRQHQRGAPHRLLVDLLLVSPVAVMFAEPIPAGFVPALAIVAAHAIAPVRNVRSVLAADLLIRAGAALAVLAQPLPYAVAAAALLLVADFYIGRRLRNIYDPVTANLTGALGMSPNSG